jgi:type VI secretion system secreted protein VgrG
MEFRPGKVAHTDYNFETPSTSLMSNTNSLVKLPGNDKFELYDYPGEYMVKGDGDAQVKVRMEEQEAPHDVVNAASRCRTFSPGLKFTVEEHHVPAEKGQKYLLTAVQHQCRMGAYLVGDEAITIEYQNTFTCIPETVVFRPARITPRPSVPGIQTAVVVGPKGEEIYTDKYGRIRVQFHWDREGKKDEKATCWCRVAQPWAGKQWGFQFIPRIGHEVVVHFVEGDADHPLVIGSVYNAENMPPLEVPANQTQSGVKTRSTKQGSAENFNQLRFEDKKGSEEVYFHAEKDFNRVVENNDTTKVGFEKKDKGDQTIEIFNNQTLKVGCAQASDGSQTIEVWKDRTEKVKTGNEKVTIEKGNRDVEVSMGNDTHKIKMGNRDVQIDMGNDALTIKMGNKTTKLNLGKSEEEAMQSIELKVGQSSIKIDQMGVTIKGMMITVEGQMMTEVKGMMTQVNGSAMLKAGGGITMIG